MADDLKLSGSSSRSGRILRRACVLGAVSILFGALAGCNTNPEDRSAVIGFINSSRANAGLAALSDNPTLDVKADAWAQHLLDICDLEHSHLQDGAPADWRKLGENVGYGGSIDQVHTAYMNSPGHRANILDPSYNQVGAAAVWGDCNGSHRVFTVQVFMKS